MDYFVITSGEDGIMVEKVSDTVLEQRLNNNHYTGDTGPAPTFLKEIPGIDKGYFVWSRVSPANPMLIIKGDIVIPKTVERVTEYKLT